jgi:hypothetical protein
MEAMLSSEMLGCLGAAWCYNQEDCPFYLGKIITKALEIFNTNT